MDFVIGDVVYVLLPFGEHFPGPQHVEAVDAADDGQPIVYLTGIEGAFDPQFLARAE